MPRLKVRWITRDLAAFAAFAAFAGLAASGSWKPLLAQQNSLNGRVLRSESGHPIVGAIVSMRTAGREARTDSLGQFLLRNLPIGDQELWVHAIGYAPARAIISLSSGPPLVIDVELEPLPPLLDRVVKTASPSATRNINYSEFEGRRAMGLGRFISRDELVRQQGRTLEAVLRDRVPGLRVYEVNGRAVAGSARGVSSTAGLLPSRDPNPDRCYVQVIIDNFVRYATRGNLPTFDLRSLDAAMIAGVEFYTVASTPVEFNRGGNAACGTLIIWLHN